MTAEFDLTRRDAYHVARLLLDADRLAGFCAWPGENHEWSEDTTSPEAQKFLQQYGEMIRAHTSA